MSVVEDPKPQQEKSLFPSVGSSEEVFELIGRMSEKLVELDQMRFLLSKEDDFVKAKEGMTSLSNSFNRLAIFLD